MDRPTNAPGSSVESIEIEPYPASSDVVETSEPEPDLPPWFGLLSTRKAEAKAHRHRPRPTSLLPWRAVVARRPIDRRRRWGGRANQLQGAGLGWNEAERFAFDELRSIIRAGGDERRDGP